MIAKETFCAFLDDILLLPKLVLGFGFVCLLVCLVVGFPPISLGCVCLWGFVCGCLFFLFPPLHHILIPSLPSSETDGELVILMSSLLPREGRLKCFVF